MNTNFLNSLTNFLKKRTFEFVGLVLISLGIALTISFATYSPSDPSLIYGETSSNVENFFGIYGSKVSDFLLQSFGLISFLILATLISWGFKLFIEKELKNIIYLGSIKELNFIKIYKNEINIGATTPLINFEKEIKKSLIEIVFFPLFPSTITFASNAISKGKVSPIGEAVAIFPAIVPIFLI